jgi:hypothetical protein
MFAFALLVAQVPALTWYSVLSVELPLGGWAVNANSVTFPGKVCGRATAQTIAPGLDPFDETVVKNPGSWPLGIAGDVPAATSEGRFVTCQTVTLVPPLATMRGMESLAASK